MDVYLLDRTGWSDGYHTFICKKINYFVSDILQTLATKEDLAQVKLDLSNMIGDSVKWMLIFWIGQMGAMMAILFLFLKK
jgi:hypothetical protein